MKITSALPIRRRNNVGMLDADEANAKVNLERALAHQEITRLAYVAASKTVQDRREVLDAVGCRRLAACSDAWAEHAEYWRRKAEAAGPDETITLRFTRFHATGEVTQEPRLIFARDRYNDLAATADQCSEAYRAQSNAGHSGDALAERVAALEDPPAVEEGADREQHAAA